MKQIKLYNLMELNVKDSKYNLVLHGKTNVNTWYVLVIDNESEHSQSVHFHFTK